MSLAELWPRRGEVSRDEIIDCLGGHLCRCTGYVGIVRAAEEAFGL
jgi:xanthine dehydrogenase iron-sulfur cluster and FAD-binding subunit A